MIFQALDEALERVRQAIGGCRVVPQLPAGRSSSLPPVDPPEPSTHADGKGQGSEPFGLFIEYCDAKGDLSHRRITVKQLVGLPPTMVLAYCHERGAPRNFRIDRIREVAFADTGEVIPCDTLVAMLMGAGLNPIDPIVRRAVNILVFLMRCDGHAHPAEWEAIETALAGFMMRFGGGDADHVRAMTFARQIAPDADDFLIGLRSFAKMKEAPAVGRWLRQAVAAVIDADGKLSPEEVHWLAQVHEFLEAMR